MQVIALPPRELVAGIHLIPCASATALKGNLPRISTCRLFVLPSSPCEQSVNYSSICPMMVVLQFSVSGGKSYLAASMFSTLGSKLILGAGVSSRHPPAMIYLNLSFSFLHRHPCKNYRGQCARKLPPARSYTIFIAATPCTNYVAFIRNFLVHEMPRFARVTRVAMKEQLGGRP